METYQLYINGQWVPSESGQFIEVENPETRQIIARVPRSCEADINKAVAAAKAALLPGSLLPSPSGWSGWSGFWPLCGPTGSA